MRILVLICKNEQSIISSCLYSVKPFIDYWVIVDTGSSDETISVIKEIFADLPGELHQRDWVNFSFNRNQALQLAENIASPNDYFLLMDADDQLVVSNNSLWQEGESHYLAEFSLNNMSYTRPLLIRAEAKWRYQGVVHEYLVSEKYSASHGVVLSGIKVIARSAGSRSRNPMRHLDDAHLLEKELEKNPNDTRSMFYLGQSYANHGDIEKAIAAYQKRCEFPQGAPEVYNSLYFIATLQMRRGDSRQIVEAAYLKAWRHSPHRAEPLMGIARYYYQQNNWELAVVFSLSASNFVIPDDLFVFHSAYTWEPQSILGLSYFQMSHFQLAWKHLNLALKYQDLTEKVKIKIKQTLIDCAEKLKLAPLSNVNVENLSGQISGKIVL